MLKDIWFDTIYLFTAIGLTHGGSSTVHIYTQTIHRTTQSTHKIHRKIQLTNWEECGPCPVFAGYTLAFALILRKKHGKTSVTIKYKRHVEVSASGCLLVQRNPVDCGVSECDREYSTMTRPWPTSGYCAMEQRDARGISFIKHQMVVTNTIRQIEISSLVDSSITNTPSVKILCKPKINSSFSYFVSTRSTEPSYSYSI
jgi:hypothetical protein